MVSKAGRCENGPEYRSIRNLKERNGMVPARCAPGLATELLRKGKTELSAEVSDGVL